MAPRSSKVLRETDIKKRYSLPTGFLSSLPSFNGGRAVDFQAVDGSGRVWPFRCSIRKNGHPKPVISKGWRAFVHSKGLKVRFHKKENEAGAKKHAYEIRAEKEIKIFGATDDRGEGAPIRQKKNTIGRGEAYSNEKRKLSLSSRGGGPGVLKFLRSLPSCNGARAVDFQAADEGDKVWTFKCSIRRMHPKPVLSMGWLAFVASQG
ncbi:hypothetical protein DKX38_021851 [Salix brachista]|uniref:TF-B3 domain-containing protein n=1 Tax=Salix brachista TaxID=2182728 RepID=A0A5N5JYR7_9ROSI|nr:hypothetical protein DKX38_021851 [Salix brachista]